MDHTEVLKPQTLDDLIQILHEIFDSDKVNTEEVQNIMESYESNPLEWGKYAKFDQYRAEGNVRVDIPSTDIHLATLLSSLCSVLQGTILGPLLFTIFINYLPNVCKASTVHMNADDPNLYRQTISPATAGRAARTIQRYTRNLVDEGNGKFNLMILCWGEGHGSSIHDHTDSHCFLKILQGNLKETMYEWPQKKNNGEMAKKSEGVLKLNQCAYINDSIGLHRVENPSHTETAVSLHLYSPPFDQCHTFDQRTGHKNVVKMTFWSKHGERTPFAIVQSQENN
uniref:Cysteine dioxygenase n=1 Tax=Leptobrachium leishanense TaxID=445787 RepID=A0A8C5PN61_9ANUR